MYTELINQGSQTDQARYEEDSESEPDIVQGKQVNKMVQVSTAPFLFWRQKID